MKCPSCGLENPDTAKFCSECGERFKTLCPSCGIANSPDAKFCNECGMKFTAKIFAKPPTNLEYQFEAMQNAMPSMMRDQIMAPTDGENRLVTVLFTDMSSSVATTKDMAPDEAAEVVNRLLKAMVDALTRYEGRVDRFLGDGALAVFGTPHVHENDPERSILAAQEIREKAKKLGL